MIKDAGILTWEGLAEALSMSWGVKLRNDPYTTVPSILHYVHYVSLAVHVPWCVCTLKGRWGQVKLKWRSNSIRRKGIIGDENSSGIKKYKSDMGLSQTEILWMLKWLLKIKSLGCKPVQETIRNERCISILMQIHKNSSLMGIQLFY